MLPYSAMRSSTSMRGNLGMVWMQLAGCSGDYTVVWQGHGQEQDIFWPGRIIARTGIGRALATMREGTNLFFLGELHRNQRETL